MNKKKVLIFTVLIVLFLSASVMIVSAQINSANGEEGTREEIFRVLKNFHKSLSGENVFESVKISLARDINKMEEAIAERQEREHPPEEREPDNEKPEEERDGRSEEDEVDTGEGPYAYLTFDDGPSGNTIRVLDILKSNNIRGTFFVTGNNTTGSNDVYRRIVREGHALGNHTYTHNFEKIYESPESFMEDFMKLENFLKELTGVRTDIMRFPGGSASQMAQDVSGYNIIVEDLISRVTGKGYDYFDWNVSSGDGTANLPKDEIVDNVSEAADRVNGDIVVLFHDIDSKDSTVAALPEVIRELEKRGYTFLPLKHGAINIKHRP